MKKYKLALVGATGLVGRTALKVLEEKCCDFSLENQSLLQMGMESYKKGVHKPIIYGDYFFTEAILKLIGTEFFPW